MVIKISYINWWSNNSEQLLHKIIKYHFGNIQLITYPDDTDIIISSCFGDIKNVERSSARCKIFYTGENVEFYPPYNNDRLLYDAFDLIIGFKQTDIYRKQINFPLWLWLYSFDKSYYYYEKGDNVLTFIDNHHKINMKKHKSNNVALIARHDKGGQRKLIADEVSKYYSINYPSTFRHNSPKINFLMGNWIDKVNYLSDYKYNICPENSKGEGYFTEKIFNALESGTIPIYWAISNPEPRILNPKSYCFADVEDKEKMKQSVNHAMENPGEYLSEPLFVPGAHKYVESLYTTLIDSLEILFIEKNIPITKITRKQSFPNYYLIIIVMVLIILIIYVCCNLTF